MATKTKKVRVEGKKAKGVVQGWLQWVGKAHYETSKVFTEEVLAQGISKRVPNVGVGQALMEPGTVIFLAHDDGEWDDCPRCSETVVCGVCDGTGKVKKGEDEIECEECGGAGEYKVSTGGWVDVPGVGEFMYREFLGRARRDKTFKAVLKKLGIDMKTRKSKKIVWTEWGSRCMHCNGSGRLPRGKVFGMFRPQAIEYIMTAEDDDEVAEAKKEAGIEPVSFKAASKEKKRGCGFRKPGGHYVVARGDKTSAEIERAVEDLIASGVVKPSGCEVVGDFVKFTRPIPISEKRFRGMKKWGLDPDAEAEAEMALDVLDDDDEEAA